MYSGLRSVNTVFPMVKTCKCKSFFLTLLYNALFRWLILYKFTLIYYKSALYCVEIFQNIFCFRFLALCFSFLCPENRGYGV